MRCSPNPPPQPADVPASAQEPTFHRAGDRSGRRRRSSTLWGERQPAEKGASVAKESTFDIVSNVDKQEVSNALNLAQKEIGQRYDFRGTGASVEFSGEAITISTSSEERAKAVKDVFGSKLVKRGISLKSFESSEPKAFGKEYRIEGSIKEGIDQPTAKKISKQIRDEGPK